MKCSQTSLLSVALLALAMLAAPASASNNPLAGALGNLRWGMRDHDVKSALKGDLLGKEKLAVLEKSYVEFDGHPTPWDNSPIAEEYTHGNDESMMSVEDDEGVKNYFFFIGGELWKWVKLYPASKFAGRDFAGFSQTVTRRFGKGHAKTGEVNSGSGKSYRFIEYVDRNTRVRAIDKAKQQGNYALVFESLGTVRSLASLRANSRPGASARAMTADQPGDDEPKAAKGNEAADDEVRSTVAATKGRSIFGNSDRDNAAKEETGRKARPQANARKAQSPQKAGDKQSRSLDTLGAEDDDPLTGLP